jgi:hypothetical protein
MLKQLTSPPTSLVAIEMLELGVLSLKESINIGDTTKQLIALQSPRRRRSQTEYISIDRRLYVMHKAADTITDGFDHH